jgi:TrpR-related protein YerC/YecD
MSNNLKPELFKGLITTLVSIENKTEMAQFMKDLCTPQELKALSERWQVCKLLHNEDLTYREINDLTGVSIATITRVARFLKNEPHNGYRSVLNKKKSN